MCSSDLASNGWTFGGWSGACSGSSNCSVTMTADRTVTATFVALPLAPPATVDARFNGGAAAITWPSVLGATSYDVARSDNGQTFTTISSPATNSANDATVVAGYAYLYRVRAKSSDGTPSNWSAPDLMTAIAFTNDPLLAHATAVKALHVTELRSAVNAVRALAGLSAATFANVVSHGTSIRAIDVTELRNALMPARSALSLAASTFTRSLQSGVTVISAIDFAEVREGVR